MPLPPEQAAAQPLPAYSHRAHHPEPFNPFDPDPLGALREAYAYITQPVVSDGARLHYCRHGYNELVAMLGRAIRNASQRQQEAA